MLIVCAFVFFVVEYLSYSMGSSHFFVKERIAYNLRLNADLAFGG